MARRRACVAALCQAAALALFAGEGRAELSGQRHGCGNGAYPTPPSATSCCEALGWKFPDSSFDAPGGVCGESDKGGRCERDQDFFEAYDICRERGARLCTIDELSAAKVIAGW